MKEAFLKFTFNLFFLLFSFLFFSLSISDTLAQSVDSTEYYPIKLFRIKQENDLYQYWYQSDKDFTDGLHFELFHPVFNNKASDWFLIGFKENEYNDFSLSIGQDIYTPENIVLTQVDSSDRPYNALLYFTYSKFSNQFFRGRRIQSNFFFGISGKHAYGEEVQNGVHQLLDNQQALGWSNQINTGLMLDYDLTYNQLLPLNTHFFETSYYGKVHIGSIFNYASGGLSLKIGHYGDSYLNDNGYHNAKSNISLTENDYLRLSKAKKRLIPKRLRDESIDKQLTYLNNRLNRKFQCYFTIKLQFDYSFFDGTSEGSLIQFNESVYVLKKGGLESILLQGEYSINVQYNNFSLSFNRTLGNNIYEKDQLFGFGEFTIGIVL